VNKAKLRRDIQKIEHGITVARCIRELIGPDNRGTPKKRWVNMTPTRYGHATEMLKTKRFAPQVVIDSCNFINTSAWLKKPVCRVTAEDVEQLLQDKPWEEKTENQENTPS